MLGVSESPGTLNASLTYLHPEDRARIERAVRNPPPPGTEISVEEFRLRHADGHWLWVEGRGQSLRVDEGGGSLLSAGTIADISRRKQIESERQLTSVVFTGISDGICITDPDTRILTVNEAFVQVTGYSADEAIGQTPALLKSGVHGQAFYQGLWDKLNHEDSWQGEITNRRKNGELVNEWLHISAVRDSNGKLTHYVGLFSDLSERREAAERIQYLSSYDPLTDLPNRSLLTDRLAQALINAGRFERQTAVILLDLDHFRLVNESFGPPVGDALLQEIAHRLQGLLREGDTLGRRSGTEFGFVMANLSHERDAIALAQRLLDAIGEPFTVGEQTLLLTASIGISLAPRDGNGADDLLKTADIALSRAKQAGRNTFRFYAPEMDADAARRLGLESALRSALKNDELSIHYQPQVSLETGRVIGMEALVRWQNPAFGKVSPAEFIPLAEDNGMILPIGEWEMAAIGQLAAGVAHEINNPVGFVNSNLGSLKSYTGNLLRLVDAYENGEAQAIAVARQAADLEFLREDLPSLLAESQEGLDRVTRIVQDLKDFSRVDQAEHQRADLNAAMNSTLNVVRNELKYKADVIVELGDIPEIDCVPAQLNQVFMNLLVNAAQAIPERGEIFVRSGVERDHVWFEIEDTGCGMSAETRQRIFEPFFTTKPVGKGTGLGLSISYDIIVKRHHGRLDVHSEPGNGTTFRIWLPIVQSAET